MGAGARTGELVEIDPELAREAIAAQVDDGQRAHVDAPQPPALGRGIDGAPRCGRPLGPYRLGRERRVQWPGLARTVVAALGDGGTVGRKGGRVEAGLAMDATAEGRDRVQT